MSKLKFYFGILLFLSVIAILIEPVFGQAADLNNKIQEYQSKLKQLGEQKNTLSSQIQYMDTQISLTELTIKNTEQKVIATTNEIETLETRISGLDSSLTYLSSQLVTRIAEGYKNRSISLFNLVFDSADIGSLLGRIKYFKTAQNNNQKMLVQVQEAKVNFEEQKKLRQEKITELDVLKNTLERQKVDLASQKGSKQRLLEETKNDEKIYQDLLAKAQREQAAIQGIVSVGANEILVSDVNKGDQIATIIPGPSCNSGGAHTHFIVKDNSVVSNPFNYLKPVSFTNCSGSSCGSGDGDEFNPNGTLDWPLEPAIELEQGYGITWAVRNTWIGRVYGFHNGIDINGASNDVKAVSDGTLYKGSYSGLNGCDLPYVKLVHKDSNIVTYYLHVYPM